MEILFEWAQQFAIGMGNVWEWLTTPLTIDGILQPILKLLGVTEIIPIYLVVGSACIFGLVRRLVGLI